MLRWLTCSIIAVAVILLMALALPRAHIDHVTVSDKQHAPLNVMIPFRGGTWKSSSQYHFSFELTQGGLLPTQYRFVAEGCLRTLTVNKHAVDLTAHPPFSLCDMQGGLVIDLKPLLQTGSNKVEATVEATSDYYGLSVSPHYPLVHSPLFFPVLLALLIGLMALRLLVDEKLRANPRMVWIAMAVIACLVRWPFFFDSTRGPYLLDFTFWDEATYLNMGRDILEGNLPYAHLWDNKPPLLYYWFAVIGFVAQGDIAWIRFFASLVIASTGFVCYLIGKRIMNAQAGWFAGILYIVFVSARAPNMSMLADHLATLPLSLAFYWALDRKGSVVQALKIGVLAGLSAITMTNYWIAVPAIAGVLLLSTHESAWRQRIFYAVMTGFFSLLPFALFLGVYALQGHTELLLNSVILSGIERAHLDADYQWWDILWQKIGFATTEWWVNFHINTKAIYWVGTLGWFACFLPRSNVARRDAASLAVLMLFVFLYTGFRLTQPYNAVYVAGMIFPHALIAGVALAYMASDRLRSARNIATCIALLCAIHLAMAPGYYVFSDVFQKLAHKRELKDDTLYQVAAIINASPKEHPTIFTCDSEQILYYLTDSKIPLYIAHPHAIADFYINQAYGKPLGMHAVYKGIKAHNPAYIIGNINDNCFDYLGDTLRRYQLIYINHELQVWRSL